MNATVKVNRVSKGKKVEKTISYYILDLREYGQEYSVEIEDKVYPIEEKPCSFEEGRAFVLFAPKGKVYEVRVGLQPSCTCEGFRNHKRCKHADVLTIACIKGEI
jgi:hypothetical protein